MKITGLLAILASLAFVSAAQACPMGGYPEKTAQSDILILPPVDADEPAADS